MCLLFLNWCSECFGACVVIRFLFFSTTLCFYWCYSVLLCHKQHHCALFPFPRDFCRCYNNNDYNFYMFNLGILLGVGGTIHNTHTLKPFKELGLDSQRVKKLASKLHVHSVNFAAKLVHTRRALSSTVINSHQEPVSGQACNPPDPHWFFPFLFAVEELYCTWYQSGSFSLINVGSGFHSVVFLFFSFL